MGNSYPILEKEAIDYLCGLIRNITNITDSLDDLHVRTDGTFSSHKIDTLLQIILNEANEYTDQITSALVRITAEEMTEEPTLDNTVDKINTLIIYSPTGDTKYNQYLRLENKLIDFGPAEIDMSNVYTKEQANAKFALVTDIEGIIDVIGSENMGTTATTLKGAIKEVKETVDNIEPSVEISWADYQALSEEEKNNDTVYYIPDMPVSSGESYSTEEQVIGTWIDGKPLYRRVINSTTPNVETDGTPTNKTMYITECNVETMVTLRGIANISGVFAYSGQTWNDYSFYLNYVSNEKFIGVSLNRITWANQPLIVILEYTKTTD